MKYILVEDVHKILDEMYNKIHGANYIGILRQGLGQLNSLPSIDPEAMIEEMIEKYEDKIKCVNKDDYTIGFLHGLKASKERMEKFQTK